MNYIKMSPLTGMVGYGGGPSGLIQKSGGVAEWYGDRGIPKMYWHATKTHYEVEYITISSTGNGQDFGDLSEEQRNGCGFGGQGMGVLACGKVNSSGMVNTASMQYLTFATLGSSADFGGVMNNCSGTDYAACCDGNRGLITGGGGNHMEYTELATKSNGATFGVLAVNRDYHCCTNDDTYGVNWGSAQGDGRTSLDYVTIQTTSNASTFGTTIPWTNNSGETNPLKRQRWQGLCSDNGRGLGGGGYSQNGSNNYYTTAIEYITHTSPGNCQDFGDLTVGRQWLANGNCSNSTRGVFSAGENSAQDNYKKLDYITFDTTSNATTFGELGSTNNCENVAACSGN